MASARLPQPGDLVGRKYLIERALGSGAVGTVYLAIDQMLGRSVAIKVVDPGVANDPQVEERFHNEARLARHLTHPNTIQIFDFGRLDNGLPYMVMEFLRGKDLKAIIDAEGSFSIDRTLHVGRQILSSLAEAHSCGIIHRDLKPSNVIVGDFGGKQDFVKVVDFGIAKVLDDFGGGGDNVKTRAGMIVGSPAYMAPERLRGGKLLPCSDLFSWGILLAEMLCGHSIYGNMHVLQILATHADMGPVPLPDEVRNGPLGPLLDRVTSKKPDERIQTAIETMRVIDEVKAQTEGGGPASVIRLPHVSAMEPTKQMPGLCDDDGPLSDPLEQTGPLLSIDVANAGMIDGMKTWPSVYKVIIIILLMLLLGAMGVLIGLALR